MCIIAISPHDVDLIPKDTLEICFRNNPDGAGFAHWDRQAGIWRVKKGLMTFSKFWEVYNAMEFTKEDYVVIHFRVGTSGLKDAGNTHPFPITKNIKLMRRTEFNTRNLLIHNGVVGKGEEIPSDTMCFVRDYIAPLHKFIKKESRIIDIIHDFMDQTKSRFFMTQGSTIFMHGEWVDDKATGHIYSNNGYKELKSKTKVYYMSPWGRGTPHNVNPTRTPSLPTGPKSLKDYYNSAGEFDSNTWCADIARQVGLLPAATLDKNNTIHTNYDDTNHNDYVYAVITDDGSIMWDSSPEPKDGVSSGYTFCPECHEDRHLMESPFVDDSDTLCCKCGALFIDATGKILGYDAEYRDIYLQVRARKEIANGSKN